MRRNKTFPVVARRAAARNRVTGYLLMRHRRKQYLSNYRKVVRIQSFMRALRTRRLHRKKSRRALALALPTQVKCR